MSRITIDTIAQELKSEDWKILSTEYTNLSSELIFQCPEGHKVFTTWERLRRKRECPICKQNNFKENKPIIIPKKKNCNRVLALDQSSHITGWSIFDGADLIKYGIFTTSAQDETARCHEVKIWLVSMIENWKPDIVAIEGIQYQQSFGVTTFQTLARLQGILIDLCYGLSIPCNVCPTNTWRAHCGVKGTQRADRKRSMQLLVKKWFDVSVTDDEADAIGIGKYAADAFKKQTEVVSWE